MSTSNINSIPIKYPSNRLGFADNNNSQIQYLFELIINGCNIGKKYIKRLENTKFCHLLKVSHQIKLEDIESFKVSISILDDSMQYYEVEGSILNYQHDSNIYVEFSTTSNGIALCTCHYIGSERGKVFMSPPN
jgi:hypothetical protein